MCGIAGVVRFDHAGDAGETTTAVVARLRHRGPDDEGVWTGGTDRVSVGLGATRLAIRDLSPAGHQPMEDPRTGSVIVYNGELYNADRLRRELETKGHAFRGGSDTEVLLAAYAEWGTECVRRLRGMFAFAVWDRPRRRLVLARDRLGIKPLYLCTNGGELAFASEVRALLASDVCTREIDPAGLVSFLAFGAVQEPRTIVAGVEALPPASVAVWDGGRLDVTEYWSLADAFQKQDDIDPASVPRHLRVLLEDAVARHLVSDVPLGVFASGGLDSTALIAMAALVADEPPQTVALVAPGESVDESRYIDEAVAYYGTRHTTVRLEDYRTERLVAAASALDQPSVDGVNTYLVSRAARDVGLTVALSGLGGDELFGGYPTFRLIPRLARAAAVPQPVREAFSRHAGRVVQGDRGRKLERWLRDADGMGGAYAVQRELLSRDVVADLTGMGDDSMIAVPPGLEGANAVSYLEMRHYMRNTLLRDSDAMSMATSLELRVPFLDHRLVEFVAALPSKVKFAGQGPKPLLTAAIGDLLPPGLVNRPKMGFVLPLDTWMRGPGKDHVEESLCTADGPLSAVLDGDATTSVWRDFLDGRTTWARPWALFVLKRWTAEHLDTVPAAA